MSSMRSTRSLSKEGGRSPPAFPVRPTKSSLLNKKQRTMDDFGIGGSGTKKAAPPKSKAAKQAAKTTKEENTKPDESTTPTEKDLSAINENLQEEEEASSTPPTPSSSVTSEDVELMASQSPATYAAIASTSQVESSPGGETGAASSLLKLSPLVPNMTPLKKTEQKQMKTKTQVGKAASMSDLSGGDDAKDSYETPDITPVRKLKPRNKQTEEEKTILDNPEVRKARNRLYELAKEPEGGFGATRPTQQLLQAMRAKTVAAVTIAASTRLPASCMNIVADALSLMEEQIVRLECRLKHAEAKAATLAEQVESNREQSVYIEVESTEEERPSKKLRKRRPRHITAKAVYDEAVVEATTSILIQSKDDRKSDEVFDQLCQGDLISNNDVQDLKHLRRGVKVQYKSAEQAAAAFEKLCEADSVKQTLEIKQANLKLKKVMVFHVPSRVTRDVMESTLRKVLNIDPKEESSNYFQFQDRKKNRNTFHAPITLLEPYANYLLRQRKLFIGFKNCPVKPFINITRCHNCQGYDHYAKFCRKAPVCANCSGEHLSRDCNSRSEKCTQCRHFNEHNKGNRASMVDFHHTAYSSRCHVYNTLLKVRQIELERGTKILTSGDSVVRGDVRIHTYRGNPTVKYERNVNAHPHNTHRDTH